MTSHITEVTFLVFSKKTYNWLSLLSGLFLLFVAVGAVVLGYGTIEGVVLGGFALLVILWSIRDLRSLKDVQRERLRHAEDLSRSVAGMTESERLERGPQQAGLKAKYCTSCGVPLPRDSRFCPKCGKPIAEAISKSYMKTSE